VRTRLRLFRAGDPAWQDARQGRYLVALFAIMLYPSAVNFIGGVGGLVHLIPHPQPGWAALSYLPLYVLPALTACAIIITAVRSSTRIPALPTPAVQR